MWTVSVCESTHGAKRTSSYRGWCIASCLRWHSGWRFVLPYPVMSKQRLSMATLLTVISDVDTSIFRPPSINLTLLRFRCSAGP